MNPQTVSGVGQRLRKPCRLRHKILVDGLFSDGASAYAYPLRVVWRRVGVDDMRVSFRPGFEPRAAKVQMLVSVPKRKLRHAVDRVLMRRRIREAYRRLLPEFEARVREWPDTATISLAIVYIAGGIESYAMVERKLARLMEKITP